MKKTLNEQFMIAISQIKNPELFVGVANLLGVRLVGGQKTDDDHYAAREFSEVFGDVMNKFSALDRAKRKELIKIIEKANKAKDV